VWPSEYSNLVAGKLRVFGLWGGGGGDKPNLKYFEEKPVRVLPVGTEDRIDLCSTGGVYTYLHCLSHGQQSTYQ